MEYLIDILPMQQICAGIFGMLVVLVSYVVTA